MSLIRFVNDYKAFDKTKTYWVQYLYGHEIEYYDSYVDYNFTYENPENQELEIIKTTIYRVKNDTYFLLIPATEIVEIPDQTNNATKTSQFQDWREKVTKDQITREYESFDFVKHTREILGIDIASKPGPDKTDYRNSIKTNPKEYIGD